MKGREPGEKIKYKELSANIVAFIICRYRIYATVLAESSLYLIFSPGFICFSDVYRRESGRCRKHPLFLNFFFIISPFQVFLLYWYNLSEDLFTVYVYSHLIFIPISCYPYFSIILFQYEIYNLCWCVENDWWEQSANEYFTQFSLHWETNIRI